MRRFGYFRVCVMFKSPLKLYTFTTRMILKSNYTHVCYLPRVKLFFVIKEKEVVSSWIEKTKKLNMYVNCKINVWLFWMTSFFDFRACGPLVTLSCPPALIYTKSGAVPPQILISSACRANVRKLSRRRPSSAGQKEVFQIIVAVVVFRICLRNNY